MRFIASFLYVQLISACVLVLLYSVVLTKVIKGSKYKFIIYILILLLISNVATIVYTNDCQMIFELFNNPDDNINIQPWLYLQLFVVPIKDSCFNVAHLSFAFEYFKLARIMPYVLKQQDVPLKVITLDQCIFRFWLFLNILAPILEGVGEFGFNSKILSTTLRQPTVKTYWDPIQFSFKVLVGLLQCVIGGYLGYAVFKIRQLQLESGK